MSSVVGYCPYCGSMWPANNAGTYTCSNSVVCGAVFTLSTSKQPVTQQPD